MPAGRENMHYILRSINFYIVIVSDAVLISLAYFLAYSIRFDSHIPPDQMGNFLRTLWWILPVKLFCLFVFDMYKGMWRYTSLHDLVRLVRACLMASALVVMIILALHQFQGFSRSVFIIDLVLCLLFVGGFRVSIRMWYARGESGKALVLRKQGQRPKRVLIIGAGTFGEKLIREIRENPGLNYDIIGLLDDDMSKQGLKIHGVPVLATVDQAQVMVKHYKVDEIIIAIARITAIQMRRVVGICRSTGRPFTTMPGLGEVLEGRISVDAIRPVRYEDLLGREPVELETERIGGYLTGKRVLVTGGAGSIGSELCRQIGGYDPSELIIMERAESGLYDIEHALRARYPGLTVRSVLGPIQNKAVLGRVFFQLRPQVVFHAAAYKHVPMMEFHPWEAVFSNIIGTYNVLDMCERFGVERCVVVSTDKAVRPTNVMGASKRVGELLMQAFARKNKTRYMAVRFGNVVGSAGSVVPLFQKQIQRGGPVTVTHPEVTRYFMSIPEACSLILQAGAIGEGGEIFVLKMGVPIRIVDMACDIITLSGYKPHDEIEIVFTGLRPGEKLHEELITEGEDIEPTRHKDILVLQSQSTMALDLLERRIRELKSLAEQGDAPAIRRALQEIVPEYTPDPRMQPGADAS